jgi:hypothetical protein
VLGEEESDQQHRERGADAAEGAPGFSVGQHSGRLARAVANVNRRRAAVNRTVRGAGLAAAIALLCAGLWQLTAHFTLAHFNSDLLFVESVFRDLADHRPLQWCMPRVVGLFPDLALFLPLRALSGDLGLALFGYAAAAIAAWIAGAAWLLGQARPKLEPSIGLPLVAAACVLVAGLNGAPSPLPVALWPMYHGGVLVAGLPLSALALHAIRKGWTPARASLWVALVAAILFCDLYLLPQIVGPLSLAAWLTRKDRDEERRILVGGVLLGIAIVVDLLLLWLLLRLGLDFSMNPALAAATQLLSPLGMLGAVGALIGAGAIVYGVVRLPSRVRVGVVSIVAIAAIAGVAIVARANCANLVCSVPALVGGAPLLWIAAFAGIGAAVAALVRREAALRPIALFLLLAVGSSLLCGAVGWQQMSDARYLEPVYVLSILLGAPLAIAQLRASRWIDLGCLAAVAASGALLLAAGPIASARAPYPDAVRCLDRAHAELGLHDGYSGYWTAKYTKALSHTPGLTLSTMQSGTLTIDPTIANRAWFLDGSGQLPRYDFAIVVDERVPDEGVGPWDSLKGPILESRFGAPASVRRCGAFDLWIYDRPEDLAFRNHLRIPSLQLLGRPLPSRVAPASLNDWRRDGSAIDQSGQPGVIPIAPGATLEVTLDPVEANVVEIALGAGEAIELDVSGTRFPVGTRAGDGLRPRYLSLDQLRKIDHLTLRNPSTIPVHVGHVFLYRE